MEGKCKQHKLCLTILVTDTILLSELQLIITRTHVKFQPIAVRFFRTGEKSAKNA